ncbi:MAG: SRPBCC domain-containing protein [bacterium]
MAEKKETYVTTSENAMTITRIVNANREMVFEAFTNAEQLAQWFGPRIFSATAEIDPKVGGKFRCSLYGDVNGPEEFRGPFTMKGEYLEFKRPELIVQTSDVTGHPDWWMKQMQENIPNYSGQDFLRSILTVSFEEVDANTTKVSITSTFASNEVRDVYLKTGGADGWSEGLDQLEELLEGK